MVCFDISHIQGTDTVGSVVMFENGAPKKAGYRHMRIRGEWGNDDFRSMEEAVSRYFRRALEEGSALPDLVVIDGGKGQLNSALEALRELDLPQVAVVALAKTGGGGLPGGKGGSCCSSPAGSGPPPPPAHPG